MQPLRRVLGVAVDVFEPVSLAIRGGHQFDHTDVRMAGDTGRFVEQLPAFEICLDIVGQITHHILDADMMNEAHHIVYAYKRDKGFV